MRPAVAIALLMLAATGAWAQGAGRMGPGGMMGPGGPQGGMGPGGGMGGGGMMGGQQGQRGPGLDAAQSPRFRNIDLNGDGFVTQEELLAHERFMSQLRQNWEQADQNGDGQVDPAEFAAFEQRSRSQFQQGTPPGARTPEE